MNDKILQAIEVARKDFKELKKSGENNFFKSKAGEPHRFSTLDDIANACKEALDQQQVSISYICEYNEGLNFLRTVLTHIPSGQYLSSTSVIGNQNSRPQEVGSGITYFRRYHIQAMLNLEADFEDDGNQASGNNTNEVYSNPKRNNASNYNSR